jgi:hypothetical protein
LFKRVSSCEWTGLGRRGCRGNSIPGLHRHPILEKSRNTPIWDAMTALTPMARLGRPEDIAAGVTYSPATTGGSKEQRIPSCR